MNLANLTAGNNIPNEFNVVIEIPANGSQVKYEVDKNTGILMVDRFMPTAMHYPCNYGYIPSTLADDGDPADVLLLTPFEIQAGCLVKSRAIGMLKMEDENGQDNKILAVPVEKVCVQYADIQSMQEVPQIMLDSIVHFFEHYKDLEPNKWVKVTGWADQAAAHQEIEKSVAQYA